MGWLVLGLAVYVFALVVLVLCWRNGDVRVRTKVILTLFYVASWGLLLTDYWHLFRSVQFVLLVVTGVITFGREFLMGRS